MTDRCAAAEQCVALTSDGAAITNQPLCHGCVRQLQERLDQLRGVSTIQMGIDREKNPVTTTIRKILPLFKGGVRGESGEAKVSKGKSVPPCVINCHVLDVIDAIEEVLADIGSLQIADLARHENGVGRALRAGWAWKQADGIIGISRAWTRRFSPCPECGQRSLGQYAGDSQIFCSSCGFQQTLEEYSAHIITVRKS